MLILQAMKYNECIKFLSSYESLNELLISSSQEGNIQYFKLFLERGADKYCVDNEWTGTSLWWSYNNGHLDIVKLLINNVLILIKEELMMVLLLYLLHLRMDI